MILEVFYKSIKLSITAQDSGDPPKIFTPVLTIRYGTVSVDDIETVGEMLPVRFEVEYVKSLENFWCALFLRPLTPPPAQRGRVANC